VLPIGGVKEKVLAARQAKISNVILPRLNKRDVGQIGVRILHGMSFHYVETMDEVLAAALLSAREPPDAAATVKPSATPGREIPVAAEADLPRHSRVPGLPG